jgi:uncharacterized delta-60 repeat protein
VTSFCILCFLVQSSLFVCPTKAFGQAAVQAWAVRYNGVGKGEDDARKVATDSAGNVYVTGASAGKSGTDIVTIKYSSSGEQQWLARYSTPVNSTNENKPYDLIVDAQGNVYVTGYSLAGSDPLRESSITIKYNTAGVQQWIYVFSASQAASSFEKSALAVDAAGNVYISTTRSENLVTFKLAANGTLLWRKEYAKGSASALTLDPQGNVYVAGQAYNANTDFDFLTIKYNSTGVQQWAKQYSPSLDKDETRDIAVDTFGNVYVTGNSTTDYVSDIVTLKYSASGTQLWINNYDADPGNSRDQVSRLLLDSEGNVLVAGYSYNQSFQAPFWEFTTIKYQSNGSRQWIAKENLEYSSCYDMVLDGSDNVYLTGTWDGKYATFKYNAAGTKQWEAFYSSGYTEYSMANSITLDTAANVIVTGYSTTPSSLGDFYTIKYNNYNATPALTGFAPAQVPVGAGVAIRGVNFKNVTEVRFNGVAATNVSVESSELIIATVPAGATSGPIQVVVGSNTIVSAANLTVGAVSSAWQTASPMPTARNQHGAAMISSNGKAYAFGGANDTELATMDIFSTHNGSWSSGPAMPAPVRGMGYVTGSDNQIYVMGGYGGTGNNPNHCYRFNPTTNTWTSLADMPTAVWAAAATATSDGKIYVFGGQTSGGWLNSYTQVYNIATNTWSENYMPYPVMQHQAVTGYNGKIYIFGGRTTSVGNLSDRVQIYDPATNFWSEGAAMPVPKAQFSAVRSNDGRIYLIGGKGSSILNEGPFFNSVEIYYPNTDTWQSGPALPAPVSSQAAVNVYGNILVLGGNNGTSRNYNWQLVVAPLAPSSAKAQATAFSRIDLTWYDAAGNEDRYEVERSLSASGPWDVIATLPKNSKIYSDSNCNAATTYYYRIRGANAAGFGSYSKVVSATTPANRNAVSRQEIESDVQSRIVASPNPFSDRISISFSVNEPAYVTLAIYDLRGALVKEVYAGPAEAHLSYTFEVDGSTWQQGMYLSRLNYKGKSIHQKIVLAH